MAGRLAWSARVSPGFRRQVVSDSRRLGIEPSWMMTCMAFETGETFNPAVRNIAGSGAVGLIQFMPSTAAVLGTTIELLAVMTAEQQLQYVGYYFSPWSHRLHDLGDVYGAILWPGMINKPDGYVVFNQADPNHPKRYLQNKGLDFNRDGHITRGEIISRVQRELDRGLLPENLIEENIA